MRQALKVCEKRFQLMSPIPVPHSIMHYSREIFSANRHAVAFATFHAAFCYSSSLVPHVFILTAPTRVGCITNWDARSAVAIVGKG